MYIRYRMNLWLPVTHWTNSKIGMLMSILALARPAVAVPRKSEACPKRGIRTSLKHFLLKHLQKRKLWKVSDFKFDDSTAMPRWFQTHLPHWHFRWDGCSTSHSGAKSTGCGHGGHWENNLMQRYANLLTIRQDLCKACLFWRSM